MCQGGITLTSRVNINEVALLGIDSSVIIIVRVIYQQRPLNGHRRPKVMADNILNLLVNFLLLRPVVTVGVWLHRIA